MRFINICFVLFISCSHTANASVNLYVDENKIFTFGDFVFNVLAKDTLAAKNPIRYSVKNLFDGNNKTAWVTHLDVNRGLYEEGHLRVVFDKPVYLRSINIANGYQKDNGIFEANERVKEVSIEKVIVGGRSLPLENRFSLMDVMGYQSISMTKGWTKTINLFETKEVIINFHSVYDGDAYADLCISEISFDVAEGYVYEPMYTWRDLKSLIDANKVVRGYGWDIELKLGEEFDVFSDLVFYALSNKEALEYFYSFNPSGSGLSVSMKNIFVPAMREKIARDI